MGVFPDSLTFDDFALIEGSVADNTYEISDAAYTLAYELAFEKGEGIALGQGSKANQTDAVGRIYQEVDEDTGVDITGYKLRIDVLNRQDNKRRTISQFTDGQITRGAGDRSQRQPFPIQERDNNGRPVFVGYPYKLGLQYKLNDGTTNIDDAEAGTVAEIDCLRYEDTGQ